MRIDHTLTVNAGAHNYSFSAFMHSNNIEDIFMYYMH